jgi:hypothetical protein
MAKRSVTPEPPGTITRRRAGLRSASKTQGRCSWSAPGGQPLDFKDLLNTGAEPRVIADDLDPANPAKPLKSNDPKKSRNHRQKSSKIVKMRVNTLNSLRF